MKRSLTCLFVAAALLVVFFVVVGRLSRTNETDLPATQDGAVDLSTAGDDAATTAIGSGIVRAASGTDGLSREQEATLENFMDTWYTALALLSKIDFTDLITDGEQASYAATALGLQIDQRASEPLDYSLDSYEYTLTYELVVEQEDGTVFIRASEDSVQHFAAFPEVDAKRYGAVRMFTLEQVDGAWTISAQTSPDTLFYLLYSDIYDDGDDGDYSSYEAVEATKPTYCARVSEYFAEYQSARQASLAQPVTTSQLPTAAHAYDAAAALAYAVQYIDERNDDWANYGYLGGNCQNFVSQCLYTGGIPMDEGGASWYWYGDATRAPAWSSVNSFLTYAENNDGSGLVAVTGAPYGSGQAGDTLHLGTISDGYCHATIIAQTVQDDSGATVDYLVNSNTADLQNYPASLYGFTTCTLTRIIGWND